MSEYLVSVRALQRLLNDRIQLNRCLEGAPPLAQQIAYGVTRNYFSLSAILNSLLEKPLANKHNDLKLLLLCGLYSVDELKRPIHASVNFSVEAAKDLKKPWAKGLINGILRRYAREQHTIKSRVIQNNVEAQLEHPEWLVSLISNAWFRPAIFKANRSRAPMTLRVNRLRSNQNDYLNILRQAKIKARPGSLTDTAIILEHPMLVDDIPGFYEGLVSIQDEGAQLAANLLNTSPGSNVLDACAAPGGKTGHLLEHACINLTAVDQDRKRIDKVFDNLKRLGLKAKIRCIDLASWQTNQRFDCILLDAPCSATGIMRRHPDIMLLRDKSDIDKLFEIQSLLLGKVFSLLLDGGDLLYSTCSILPQENDRVIEQFLSTQPKAALLPIDPIRESDNLVTTDYGLQLFPTVNEHDGFYYSKLRRKKS